MEELICSLHIHTKYSDGSALHNEIANIALENGIDVVITTDHNVLVRGIDGYQQNGERKVLLFCGEEIHNTLEPVQKNHLIVLGVDEELAPFGNNVTGLINQAIMKGGVTIIAHPYENALPAFNEPEIGWEESDISGINCIEIWNQMSELKTTAKNWLDTVFLVFFPQRIAHNPDPRTMLMWDKLLLEGKKIMAIGGADAHALIKHIGPFNKKVFPYEFHFMGITTHLLVEKSLSDEISGDKRMILNAIKYGHSFIGYDLPHPTRGFRFSAMNSEKEVGMGDTIDLNGGITLKIRIPGKAEIRLIKDGEVINIYDMPTIVRTITEPGIYRVECYIDFLGKKRGWIFSNPIFVVKSKNGA